MEENNLTEETKEEPTEQTVDQPEESTSTIEQLEQKILDFEQELTSWKDKYIRKVAEFDNYKRRTDQEQSLLFRYAGEQIAVRILPVLDDIERSLQHVNEAGDPVKVLEGVQLIYDKFVKILTEQGITKFEAVGQPFSVELHDALYQQPSAEVPDQTVLQEIEAGYKYKDKVIRHAKVIVSSAPEETGEEKE
jgi:molecular chaperone GrpE